MLPLGTDSSVCVTHTGHCVLTLEALLLLLLKRHGGSGGKGDISWFSSLMNQGSCKLSDYWGSCHTVEYCLIESLVRMSFYLGDGQTLHMVSFTSLRSISKSLGPPKCGQITSVPDNTENLPCIYRSA